MPLPPRRDKVAADRRRRGGEIMVGSASNSFRFGVYELDLRSGELLRSGLRVRLQPQPLKVLSMLLERAGEVVTREEIQAQIWGNETFVDFERGLNYCIKQIRAALNDDAETPRFVETLPRRGYRFIAAVEAIAAESPPQEGSPVGPSKPAVSRPVMALLLLGILAVLAVVYRWLPLAGDEAIRSIAVLPLDNLSGDPDQEYFADGITEALIAELGKISALRVISRQSVMQYKDTAKSVPRIARELRVDAIVEGSVQQDGEQVRVTAQLIGVKPERHLWADSYDREMNRVLDLTSDLARAIAREIQVVVTPEEEARLAGTRAVNPEAYEIYLKGRHNLNQRTVEGFVRATMLFEEAVVLDPNYAPALAGMADAYSLLGSTGFEAHPPRETMERAKHAALEALEADDTLAEAHTAMALILMMYDWDWTGAEEEFLRALDINPSYATAHQWYGQFLWVVGRPDEALAQIEEARRLDRFSIAINATLGMHHYYAGQYDQAIEQFHDALDIWPDLPLLRLQHGVVLTQQGRLNEAIVTFRAVLQAVADHPIRLTTMGALGHALGLAGRENEARALLGELERLSGRRYVSGIYPAAIHAGLGEKDQAFAWLEKAYEDRSDYLLFLPLDPIFDSLHDDPRFADLLARLNLRPQ